MKHRYNPITDLFLIFLIPMTIGAFLFFRSWILWDVYGDSSATTEYYTSRFDTFYDSIIWIMSQIGFVGCFIFFCCAIGYIWMAGYSISQILKAYRN